MLSPIIWGKHIWTSMHIVALAFPEHPTTADREHYGRFFLSIGDVLPCSKCGVNYKKHLTHLPINFYLANRDTLFEWTVAMHNMVNTENGKLTWTVEEAKEYYMNEKFNIPCTMEPNKDMSHVFSLYKTLSCILLIMVIILIIMLFIVKK
jgi:hypothetical protein